MKVFGAQKSLLIGQLLFEYTILGILCVTFGVMLTFMLLPKFNEAFGLALTFDSNDVSYVLTIYLAFALMLGLGSGIFPAMVISSTNPGAILRGKHTTQLKSAWIRNGLVICQFAIALSLICCTIIIGDQNSYLQSKELGFNKESVIVLDRINSVSNFQTFKEEVKKTNGVLEIGSSNTVPGGGGFLGSSFRVAGSDGFVVMEGSTIDDSFIDAMEMSIIKGRDFSPLYNDSLSLIINEAAVAGLEIKGDPIGQVVTNFASDPKEVKQFVIIGVLSDFNYKPLFNEISPMAFFNAEGRALPRALPRYLFLKVDAYNMESMMSHVSKLWSNYSKVDLSYFFLDDYLDGNYRAEFEAEKLMRISSAIAILIACIGLFGQSQYIVSRRTREIGIRKILGSTLYQISFLLIGPLSKVFLFALVIALPTVILIMPNWLNGFAYHVGINWYVFVIGGFSVFVLSIFTIVGLLYKAAHVNPIDIIKNE